MLVMSFSEKPAERDLTGKFGLGFKSVHILSDGVGIASGFLALRTRGGFLPEPWPDGIDEAEKLRRDGRRATVINVPFAADTVDAGTRSLRAFRTAATWLPALARRIRRIEISGVDPVTVDCTVSQLAGSSTIDVITIWTSVGKQLALRLDIGAGYSLLLAIDGSGPCAFPNTIKRLWNLAPLEVELLSGWLLNGPFAVDPGRCQLAGSTDARQRQFQQLGQALGQRLLELYDLTVVDWASVAEALDLDASEHPARPQFWKRLFDVVSRDFDDALARFLHARDRGYGHVAAERRVTPTGLPAPFDGLARLSQVGRFTNGALTDPTVLEQVSRWPPLVKLRGRIVAREVAERLKKLGFNEIRPMALTDLLRRETGDDGRIDAETGTRLGCVVTSAAIEKGPLHPERNTILDAVRDSKFRARDEAWRHVRDLITESGGDDDEKLICSFAPESALLHPDYRGASLEFFRVARRTSGYGLKASDLGKWAPHVNSLDRRTAVLRYIISGRHGRDLAKVMCGDLPKWIPQPLERLLSDHLLTDWSDEDKKRLLIELGGHNVLDIAVEPPPLPPIDQPLPVGSTTKILEAIHEWWLVDGDSERGAYAARVYPGFFSPATLRDSDERTPWFTMLALACLQSFGRTQDGQHRKFVDGGYRKGWWREIAESRPPEETQPWLARLDDWSATQFDETYHQWQRTLVDLYTIARGLNVYVELIRRFPQFVDEHGRASLDVILRPSESPLAQQLGLDAAPIERALGIGANWMIRELLRNTVYDQRDVIAMAPYGWMPSLRVRKLLTSLGMLELPEKADKEDSRAIHDFIVNHLGADRARFGGDFDLPLQLITRAACGDVLRQCFEQGGLDAPGFEQDDKDYGDDVDGGDTQSFHEGDEYARDDTDGGNSE